MDVQINTKSAHYLSTLLCLFFPCQFVTDIPGGEASQYPNGKDDEEGSHAGASVAGPQRSSDDVIALERDGQNSQHRRMGHRQFDERHQFTWTAATT